MAERLKAMTDGIIGAVTDGDFEAAVRTIDSLEPVEQGEGWAFSDVDQAAFDAATSVIAERAEHYSLDSDQAALVVQMMREKAAESEV